MKFPKLPKLGNMRRVAKLQMLRTKKAAPTILLVGGSAGVVVGTVLACKKTLELEGIIEETQNDILEAKELPAEVSKKEVAKAYLGGAARVGKLYAGPIILEGLSLGMIFGSNNIMKKRNAAAVAAYATLDTMYKRYRNYISAHYGEEADYNARYGVEEVEISEIVGEGKKAKVVKKKETVVSDPTILTKHNEFSRWYDESCRGWDKDISYRLDFLLGVERMCNNKLIADGFLFLNDVYESLGIEKTWAGQFVGWLYDPNDERLFNHVSFGIFEDNERKRAFVNGYERNILLDFNPDGDICNNPRLKEILMNTIEER